MAHVEAETCSWFTAEDTYLKAAAALLDDSKKKRKWVRMWLKKKEKGFYRIYCQISWKQIRLATRTF